jgi:hypothetical protein
VLHPQSSEFLRMGSGFAGEFLCRLYLLILGLNVQRLGRVEPRRTSAFQGEGKSRHSQTAATRNDLLLAWCDGRSCGRNDQIQKNLSLKRSKK